MAPRNDQLTEQGAVVLNAFFDELSKVGGIGEALQMGFAGFKKGRAITHFEEAAKHVERGSELAASANRSIGAVDEKLNAAINQSRAPEIKLTKEKEVAQEQAKRSRTVAGVAGLLGVGGLGYGYSKYKELEDAKSSGSYS